MNKYFTTHQYSEFTDDDSNYRLKLDNSKVFAKAIQSGLGKDVTKRSPSYYKYYVRVYPNKKLYDPIPIYSISDNKSSFIDKICKSENTYKEVTESIFNMYLMYLKTENSQWYNQTQREINNI